MRLKVLCLLCAVPALIAAGCGKSKEKKSEKGQTAQTPVQVKAPGAKVTFITPKDDAVEPATVTARVALTKFTIDKSAVGAAAAPNRGHLHFSMDEGKYDQPKYSGANGQLAVKLGVQGKYSPSVAPTITYRNLPRGKHKLEVYLANNDHSNTGVEAETSFTVK